jgi:hypothetical protein
MTRHERAIVSARVAMRELVFFPGGGGKGGTYIPGCGIRIPHAWLDDVWTPGKMVLLSREGDSIRVTPVDEKYLLQLIKATAGAD